MRFQLIVTLAMCFVISETAHTEEVVVQSLSEGACWYEQTEVIKLISFNDKGQLKILKSELDVKTSELLTGRKNNSVEGQNEWMIHCGGYGASLVVKTQVDGVKACAWLKLDKGTIAVRSLGGLEESKNESCDGYAWGELIVGLRDSKQVEELQSEFLSTFIQTVTKVNPTLVKIVLKKAFHGKEQSVIEELKKNMDLKYVELNFYHHPVGEFGSLR